MKIARPVAPVAPVTWSGLLTGLMVGWALCIGPVGADPAMPAGAERQPVTDAMVQAVRAVESRRVAVIEQVRPTVVSIFGLVRRGGGSGVLISPDGLALTNYHVVAACGESGWAGLADGKLYRWHLLGLDPGGDLALIRLDKPSPDTLFPFARIGASRTLRAGDWVMAMGNPFALNENLKPTVTLGIVSGLHRYQGGTGPRKTLLVYGDCIQIDSSINPGNSGGPLFDMTGRLVGINGRGSFEERGRVNVGLGYAITIEQALRFLPDLLATKVCQHGTLQATFTQRDGQVLCDQVRLDGPLGRLGLRPGDRLIRFDGLAIDSANQFTNHLATLPAGWPVQMVFQSGRQTRTVHLRLEALDYGPMNAGQRPARPVPRPQDKPQQPPDRNRLLRNNRLKPHKPGEVRDPQLNHRLAVQLIEQWRASLGDAGDRAALAGLFHTCTMQRPGKPDLDTCTVLAADGRFRRLTAGPDRTTGQVVWDGRQLLRRDGGRQSTQSADLAVKQPEVAWWGALMALYRPDGLDHFKQLALEGSDKARGRPAARIAAVDAHGQRLLFWFALTVREGRLAWELVKGAVHTADGRQPLMYLLGPARRVGRLALPLVKAQVSGLEELPLVHYRYRGLAVLDRVDEAWFSAPSFPPPALADRAGPVRQVEPPPEPTVRPANAFAQAIDYARRRCVKIYGPGIGREKGYASGLIVSEDGLILTAQGVYLMGDTLRLATPDGLMHKATVVRSDPEIQVALLKIDAPTPEHFSLEPPAGVAPGDWVLAVANPFNVAGPDEPMSVNLGVVSLRAALDTRHRAQDFDVRGPILLIDAITSNPGSAGGAVVDLDGRLVGMIGKLLASQSTNTRLNYAIPADLLKQFLDGSPVAQRPAVRPQPTGPARPGQLGIKLFTLPGRRAPAYIDRVLPGSPADAAGLRRDDLVLAIDGQPVRNVGHYLQLATTFKAGRPVRLTIKRKDKILDLTVTPAEVSP